jgi:hypothetical protein
MILDAELLVLDGCNDNAGLTLQAYLGIES